MSEKLFEPSHRFDISVYFSKKRGQTVRLACYIVVRDKNTARHIFIMQNKKRKAKKENIRKKQKPEIKNQKQNIRTI